MKTFTLKGKISEVLLQIDRIKQFCEALNIVPTVENFITYQQGGNYERTL